MNRKSIRFRLTVWYSLALCAGQMLFAVATWVSMRQLLFRDVRQLLTHQIESSRAFVEAELREPQVDLREELTEFSDAFASGTYLRVTNSRREVVFNSKRDFTWAAGGSRIQWNGKPYMVLSSQQLVKGDLWRFEVSASLSETETLLSRLRILLILLIPLVVIVAAIGGRWLSRRALTPVDEMTAAAQSISAANLSERLSVPQTGDELERLAATWNSMLARLEDSLKRLSRFTADASHELRTPLAIIYTTAELAARRARPAEVYREALDQVASESARMTKLLDDLLLLARVDAEIVEMPQSSIDLSLLVDAICSQIRPLADAKQLHINFERLEQSVPVLGNEAAIRRLILALLDNAVKYSRAGAEIHILLKNRLDHICLEVVDNGAGIDQTELPLIFNRFYRGPNGQNDAREGTGLGLSLAAGLAEQNHARIEVASQPGKGSTFRVLFRPAA